MKMKKIYNWIRSIKRTTVQSVSERSDIYTQQYQMAQKLW